MPGTSLRGSVVKNSTSIPKDTVQSLVLLSRLRIRHCHKQWHGGAATAPAGPPARELSYAAGVALKRKKEKKILTMQFITSGT